MRWAAQLDGESVILRSEPESGWWRRFLATLSKLIPERQL